MQIGLCGLFLSLRSGRGRLILSGFGGCDSLKLGCGNEPRNPGQGNPTGAAAIRTGASSEAWDRCPRLGVGQNMRLTFQQIDPGPSLYSWVSQFVLVYFAPTIMRGFVGYWLGVPDSPVSSALAYAWVGAASLALAFAAAKGCPQYASRRDVVVGPTGYFGVGWDRRSDS
jgi:hypothetical protein